MRRLANTNCQPRAKRRAGVLPGQSVGHVHPPEPLGEVLLVQFLPPPEYVCQRLADQLGHRECAVLTPFPAPDRQLLPVQVSKIVVDENGKVTINGQARSPE